MEATETFLKRSLGLILQLKTEPINRNDYYTFETTLCVKSYDSRWEETATGMIVAGTNHIVEGEHYFESHSPIKMEALRQVIEIFLSLNFQFAVSDIIIQEKRPRFPAQLMVFETTEGVYMYIGYLSSEVQESIKQAMAGRSVILIS